MKTLIAISIFAAIACSAPAPSISQEAGQPKGLHETQRIAGEPNVPIPPKTASASGQASATKHPLAGTILAGVAAPANNQGRLDVDCKTSVRRDPQFWGETYGFWTQTTVLFAAALFAYFAIVSSKRIERKKAAIGAITGARRDPGLLSGIRSIFLLKSEPLLMEALGTSANVDTDDARAIRYVLNTYDSIACGVFHGIFDENILKGSLFTTITKTFEATKPFIDVVRRSGTGTAYQELEWLACRWKKRVLRRKPIERG